MMVHDPIPCPYCRMPNNIRAGARDSLPNPGDVGLCVYCRLFSVFDRDTDGGLTLREPTDRERTMLVRDPRAATAQAIIATAPTVQAGLDAWQRDGASYG